MSQLFLQQQIMKLNKDIQSVLTSNFQTNKYTIGASSSYIFRVIQNVLLSSIV